MNPRSSTPAVVAVLLAWNAETLRGQVRLEVTPFFASYYATNYTSYKSAEQNERQEAGPGVGLTVGYHFTRTLGVQLQGAYIRSGIIPRQPDAGPATITILNPLPGMISIARLRATLQPRRSNYYAAAGIGLTRRSGEAWQNPAWTSLTDVLGSVGFGIRARITPEREFNIAVDLDLYRSDFDEAPGDYFQPRLQRDVLLSIGMPFALIGS